MSHRPRATDEVHRIAAELMAARLDAGLTQYQLGELAGMGQGVISVFERRGTHQPLLDTACALARPLGLRLVLVPIDDEDGDA